MVRWFAINTLRLYLAMAAGALLVVWSNSPIVFVLVLLALLGMVGVLIKRGAERSMETWKGTPSASQHDVAVVREEMGEQLEAMERRLSAEIKRVRQPQRAA